MRFFPLFLTLCLAMPSFASDQMDLGWKATYVRTPGKTLKTTSSRKKWETQRTYRPGEFRSTGPAKEQESKWLFDELTFSVQSNYLPARDVAMEELLKVKIPGEVLVRNLEERLGRDDIAPGAREELERELARYRTDLKWLWPQGTKKTRRISGLTCRVHTWRSVDGVPMEGCFAQKVPQQVQAYLDECKSLVKKARKKGFTQAQIAAGLSPQVAFSNYGFLLSVETKVPGAPERYELKDLEVWPDPTQDPKKQVTSSR